MTLSPNVDDAVRPAAIEKPGLGRRLWIGSFSICLILIIVAYAFTRPLEDFVEYWGAGHLLVTGGNPYSLNEMYRFERALGWSQPVPLIPLNPPWTLPLFTPFGFFSSYPWAWLIWVTILASLVALSSRILMDLYFGNVKLAEISDKTAYRCLFALSFYPVLLSLKFAQTVPIVLLGLTGFLFFETRRRPLLAGVFLGLTAIKPNLLYLLWLALLFQSFRERRWKTLATAVGMVGAFLGIALRMDPYAIEQYRAIVASPLPRLFTPGLPGAARTLFQGRDFFWLQLLLPIAGVTWFAFYWRSNRANWNWTERIPALVAVSILTTGYGWLFDQALLAIPIIALAGKYARELGYLPRSMVFLYTVINATLILLAMASSPWSFAPAPIVIAFLLYRASRSGDALSSSARYSYVGS